MDRISLESSEQSACDKDRLLNSMDGLQSDHGEQRRRRQYRPCSRCASRTRLVLAVLPWILCVTLLVGLVVAINNRPPQQECAGKETVFWRELEFETVKKEIPPVSQPHQFQAGLAYNKAHELYIEASDPAYVGPPTPEMDAAWKKIVSPVNVFVTREEGDLFTQDTLYVDVETGLYTAQVTMTHDLHCLNMIRKSGYMEHYPELESPTLRAHLDHCIDSLRESIMCTGDMTLIPVVWSANRNWIMPSFKTTHTCRNFEALSTWAKNRDAEDPKKFVESSERYKNTGSFTPKE